jgi:hypothetical protein
MGVTAPLDLQAWILKNLALGAVVSSLLVALLGYGTIAFSAAITPPEAGVNIGAAILASLGCLLAVALGAAFTAWRARREAANRSPKAPPPGLSGLPLPVVAGYLFFVVGDVPLWEIVSVAPLLLPGIGAALAGAALGSLPSGRHRSW